MRAPTRHEPQGSYSLCDAREVVRSGCTRRTKRVRAESEKGESADLDRDRSCIARAGPRCGR
eukprot:1600617-Prymnesium_polylepis.2